MSSIVAPTIDLAALNQAFETSPPIAIVQWAIGQFGDDVVMSSSFGAESAMLLHLATGLKPDIRIIFVNTGYLFPETHAFMEQLRRRLNLNVWIYRTRNDPIAWLEDHGETDRTQRKDVQACCAANKNEPFQRAMSELAPRVWLRGIRRAQAQTRKHADFVGWSKRYNCYAASPLLNLSSKDIFQYLKRHDLPYHPLWEKGYASIGCNPLTCTRAVGAGEDARSGRWAGQDKTECGINLTDSQDSAKL